MKYRKKPVEIEAVKFDGSNIKEVRDLIGIGTEERYMSCGLNEYGELCEVTIHTLEGDMKANIGDYIIKGVKGEFYPCKPDIFEMTYEKVGE